MGVSAAAFAEWVGATAATEVGTAVASQATIGTAAAAGATSGLSPLLATGLTEIGAAGIGTSAAAGLGAASSALWQQAGTATLTAGISKLFNPTVERPSLPPVTPMPDPLAQEDAKRRSVVEQLARRGRAASIMTDAGSNKLGS